MQVRGKVSSINITDLNGKTISRPTPGTTGKAISIDVSALSTGYYHLIVVVDGKAFNTPFVKN